MEAGFALKYQFCGSILLISKLTCMAQFAQSSNREGQQVSEDIARRLRTKSIPNEKDFQHKNVLAHQTFLSVYQFQITADRAAFRLQRHFNVRNYLQNTTQLLE